MVAYSFQPMFVEPIRAGLDIYFSEPGPEPKRQTIRAENLKRHALPGERLQLYCRQRHPKGFLIGEALCTKRTRIKLFFGRTERAWLPGRAFCARSATELDAFARKDGFEDWQALREFWRVHHPRVEEFEGLLIEWEPLP